MLRRPGRLRSPRSCSVAASRRSRDPEQSRLGALGQPGTGELNMSIRTTRRRFLAIAAAGTVLGPSLWIRRKRGVRRVVEVKSPEGQRRIRIFGKRSLAFEACYWQLTCNRTPYLGCPRDSLLLVDMGCGPYRPSLPGLIGQYVTDLWFEPGHSWVAITYGKGFPPYERKRRYDLTDFRTLIGEPSEVIDA